MRTSQSLAAAAFALVSIIVVPDGSRAELLRYNIKPQQVVPYDVTIVVVAPKVIETMTGMIQYTGRKVEGQNLTLLYQGGLTKKTKTKGQGRRPGFGPPRRRFGRGPAGMFNSDTKGLMTTTNTLVMSNTGNLKTLRGDSQLPYLMGNLSLLPFQSLPQDARNSWEYSKGITITSGSDNQGFGPRFGPFANNDEEVKTGGGEVSTYKVGNDDGKLVTIATTYALRSPAPTKEDSGYEMKGTGTFVFNRELGMPESADSNLTLTISGSNTTVTYPITVKWHRMSEEEVAEHKQKLEDRKAALQAQLANRNKPWAEETHTRVMKNLTDKKWETVLKELKELRKSSRTALAAEDVEVAVRAADLRSHENAEVRAAADIIWKKWGASVEKNGSAAEKKKVAAAEKRLSEMESQNPFEEVTAKGMRTWSDRSGRFKIEAEFVELDGTTVVLKKKDGTEVRIPKSRLSEADAKLVE